MRQHIVAVPQAYNYTIIDNDDIFGTLAITTLLRQVICTIKLKFPIQVSLCHSFN